MYQQESRQEQYAQEPHQQQQDSYPQDQLAGLVQAASQAAAGQEANWQQQMNEFNNGAHAGEGEYTDAAAAAYHGHFANGQTAEQQQLEEEDRSGSRGSKRRKRAHSNTDTPEFTTPPSARVSRASTRGSRNLNMTGPTTSVLFRDPASGTKSTRPKVGSMFRDLELPPEEFLNLKLAAKNYMLDANHPERRECIGSRNRGDAEIVRLRLHACVEAFLNEGNGQRFFGANVNPQLGPERLIDPRDRQIITSLLTPILRSVLTNERQRLYANATRKGGAAKKGTPGRGAERSGTPEATTPSGQLQSPIDSSMQAGTPTSNMTPELSAYARRSLLPTSTNDTPTRQSAVTSGSTSHDAHQEEPDAAPSFRITFVNSQTSHRIFPRFSIPQSQSRSLSDFHRLVASQLTSRYGTVAVDRVYGGDRAPEVSVLLDSGRFPVRDENEWAIAILAAGNVGWMDEVGVVVGVMTSGGEDDEGRAQQQQQRTAARPEETAAASVNNEQGHDSDNAAVDPSLSEKSANANGHTIANAPVPSSANGQITTEAEKGD